MEYNIYQGILGHLWDRLHSHAGDCLPGLTYYFITYFAYFYPGRTDPGMTLSMCVGSAGCCLTCPILSVTLSPLNHLNQQQNLSGAQEWKLPGSRQD